MLEMGDSIKIDELARSMIRLSGLEVCDDGNPDGEITIKYTGLRPGEKLYEELLIGDNVTGTEHSKIMCAAEEKLSWVQIMDYKKKFEFACNDFDTGKVKLLLEEVVNGYSAEKEIVDAVWNQNQSMNKGDGLQGYSSGEDKSLH